MPASHHWGRTAWITRTLGLATLLAVGAATLTQAAGEKRQRSTGAGSQAPSTRTTPPPTPTAPGEDGASEGVPAPSSIPSSAPDQPTATPEPRRKTKAYDLVRIGRDVTIHEDEVVRGDVIVLGGNLRVEGGVQGGVVVVGGNLEIQGRAHVEGDAVALGGNVESAPGADVGGGVVGLSLFPRPLARGVDWQRTQQLGALVGDAIGLALLLVWTLIVALFLPRRVGRARSWLDVAPWRTTSLGVLAMTGGLFAVVMGIVLLAITLVGLPLSLLVAFATVLLFFIALAIGVVQFGGWLCDLVRLHVRSALALGLAGAVVLSIPAIVADAQRLTEHGTGGTLRILHAMLLCLVLSAGLGALVLSRFGRHPAPSGATMATGHPTPAPTAPPFADSSP